MVMKTKKQRNLVNGEAILPMDMVLEKNGKVVDTMVEQEWLEQVKEQIIKNHLL